MYPNLKAEMARQGVTIMNLAKKTDMRYGTLALKLREASLSLNDAVSIKTALGVDMPIEELFAREA